MPKKKAKLHTSNLYPYKKIVIIYFSLTIILIISIIYLLSSKAMVLITFEPEKIGSNFIIKLGSETNLEEDTLKADILETIQESEKIFLPTQTRSIETKASGEVVIINNYIKNQPLIATTRLLSPEGLLFRTTQSVLVPASGKIKVKVVADEMGKKYEIGPTKFTIPGLWPGLQDKIYAQSETPMSSTTKNIGLITQEEIEKIKKEFQEQLIKEIKEKIKPQIIKTEKLEEKIETKPRIENLDEVEELKIKLKMKFITIKFSENELENLIKNDFKKLITQEKELLSINKENLTYDLGGFDLEKKTGKIKVAVEGNFVPNLNTLNFPKEKLVGLTKNEVKEYLNNFSLIKNVEIKLRPFWLKTMPLLSNKIEIKIVK